MTGERSLARDERGLTMVPRVTAEVKRRRRVHEPFAAFLAGPVCSLE